MNVFRSNTSRLLARRCLAGGLSMFVANQQTENRYTYTAPKSKTMPEPVKCGFPDCLGARTIFECDNCRQFDVVAHHMCMNDYLHKKKLTLNGDPPKVTMHGNSESKEYFEVPKNEHYCRPKCLLQAYDNLKPCEEAAGGQEEGSPPSQRKPKAAPQKKQKKAPPKPKTPPKARKAAEALLGTRRSPRQHKGTPPAPVQLLQLTGTKRKRGGQKGAKKVERPQSFWFSLCAKYVAALKSQPKLSHAAFLRSKDSGDEINDAAGNRAVFGKKLKQYQAGKLNSSTKLKRQKGGQFEDVEKKLVDYINLRKKLYRRDKCGMSWVLMEEKAKLFAKQCGYADGSFNASAGWIQNTLNRHGIIGIKLHGEANDLDDAEREKVMLEWTTKKFHPLLEQHNISPGCCYNADQTGLFYTKLPNRLYVYEGEKKNYAGVKQMKSKDRITMMVCTSAAGAKLPVAFVGKAKNPVCFRSCGGDLPAPYTHQKKAWFDKGVTVWWINKVFWPQHIKMLSCLMQSCLLDAELFA